MTRTDCLDAGTLAAFAEGKLRRNEVAKVVEHLDGCERCMSAIATADAVLEAENAHRPFRAWWLAAAAVIAAIAVSVPLLLRSTPMERLVKLAPRDARHVETRLSGGFAWAPYRGPARASNGTPEGVDQLRLGGETASLIEAADAKKTADAQHAAGVGLLLIGRHEDAIARLRAATDAAPANAQTWNDLAAAEYAAALQLGRKSLYPEALAHTDRALRIDPNAREALFNRACILERLGLPQQAETAWQRYLAVDGTSEWAHEAREHLAALQRAAPVTFKDDERKLFDAVVANDAKTIDAIVDRHRQFARAAAETEYLGRWGESNDMAALATARAVGDALARLSGESLLRDAVAAIDAADPARRATLANAHATYRRGRIAYGMHRVAEAEPDLRRAAALFAEAHDPMTLAARYYAANATFDRNEVRDAFAQLEQLRTEGDAHPSYIALGAQVRWELMLCAIYERDWSRAVRVATESMAGFQRGGETSNVAVIQGMRADGQLFLGRPDDAWADRIASFAAMSAAGESVRLPIAIGDAANVEIATGRLHAGRALLAVAEDAGRDTRFDAWRAYLHARDAITAAQLGEDTEAQERAREAMRIATSVADPALRTRAIADAQLAAGAIATPANPRLAIDQLTKAVDAYTAADATLIVVEAKLLRARAAAKAGDRAAALRDLDEAIAQLGTKPIRGTFVDDAGRALFEDAIALTLERGDVAAAFGYAERSRTTNAIDVATLQQRLRGSGAAILEVAGSAVFCVTERSLDVARIAASADLYDALIRPFDAQLDGAKQLIVVASDTPMQNVAFAALYDPTRKRHLIERMPVAIAPSASALEVTPRSAPRSITAVALPTGDDTAALEESRHEVDDVARLYPHAVKSDATVRALGRADVIHISGHTERLAGSGDSALLFRDARLSGNAAATMHIGHPIVVLAACETLRAAPAARARSLSVGEGFLAAGATAVVGTLEPVADNEARAIFNDIHRRLAAGEPATIAVQRAQLDALARRSDAWRAVTLLVTRIPNAG